jgi:hypothetical protein
VDPVLPKRPTLRGSADTDKWETARDLLRQREGDVSKGIPVSAKIGRLRFEDASKDLVPTMRSTV